MKRAALIALAAAALVAVAVYVGWRSTPTPDRSPPVGEALSADHTAGLLGVRHVDTLADRLLGLMEKMSSEARDELDMPGGVERVEEELGFDPRTAEGWRSIGVDPSAGVAFVLDAHASGDAGFELPLPMVLLAIEDRERLLSHLDEAQGEEVEVEELDGPLERVSVGDERILAGRLGPWTAVLVGPGDDEEARAAFERALGRDAPPLSGDETFQRAFADGGESPRKLYGYVGARGVRTFLDDAGLLDAVVPKDIFTFYASRFPAIGFHAGETPYMRLLADDEAVEALERIFVPSAAPPSFSRYVGAEGWAALRVSVDLDGVVDGIEALVPPDYANTVSSGLGFAKAMLPQAAGFSWRDLSEAFTGHAAVAVSLDDVDELAVDDPSPEALKAAAEEAVLLYGVDDAEAADALVGDALEALAKASPGASSVTQREVRGHPGHALSVGFVELVVVRVEDVLVAGASPSAVEEALARAEGEANLAGAPAASSLDGERVAYGAVYDPAPFVELARASSEVPAFDEATLRELFGGSEHVTARLTIDDRGALGASNVDGSLSALTWFGLVGALAVPMLQMPTEEAPSDPSR